ncbi:hypothetical protein LHYA1_G001998 [Lachnellula hyalina]|uniref:Protein DSF2 n=1 Tax=Lachnellula hyalina TaxID=1316788 RepID=A0A8H8R7G7_9HELO|nr:uncharacterized protein LHYA1_G001998 [Lachnellula hyalina]TVY29769.1 hypothetical protein LHYA1_G001998 [Lachnellula hyalina]
MPFKHLLGKKEKLTDAHAPSPAPAAREPSFEAPEFTFMRSDTYTQEIISPPTFSSVGSSRHPVADGRDGNAEPRTSGIFKGRSRRWVYMDSENVSRLLGHRSILFRRSKADSPVLCSSSGVSAVSTSSHISTGDKSKSKRLSERLHLRKSQITSTSVPSDLPEIGAGDGDAGESQWERRATILARENEKSRSRPVTPSGSSIADLPGFSSMTLGEAGKHKGAIPTKQADDDIQEAIRLHEAGELETSTRMFGRLADPNGENNALSQVLYGLALRYGLGFVSLKIRLWKTFLTSHFIRSGWGCTPDPGAAVKYLSAAASNAALIEELALKAGLKKGGAAKGELVLAIFELANCFRYGWGVAIDKLAAKQYYETAANLGDTDAMNEVAWCYVEGFGCKKDKWAAAKYYRLAEQGGSKTLGNSCAVTDDSTDSDRFAGEHAPNYVDKVG